MSAQLYKQNLPFVQEDGAILEPTKTTRTAAYAAVAPSTSLPALSLAMKASRSAKRNVATEAVMRLVFLKGCRIMINMGPTSATSPNIATTTRQVNDSL